MSIDSFSKEVQILLANILEKPIDLPGKSINILFPELESINQQNILIQAQQIIQDVLDTKASSGSPALIQRLRFSWKILKNADKYIKKIRKRDLETLSVTIDSMKKVFHGILPTDELHSLFVEKLCERLFIKQGKNAGLIKFYWEALRPKPKNIELTFIDKNGNVNTKILESAINWIIRKNNFIYVVKDDGRFNIHFQYLSQHIKEKLDESYSSEELDKVNNLLEIIENQINNWLGYSCLQGEDWDNCTNENKEKIADFFKKDNELKNKIFIGKPSYNAKETKRISSLEKENAELVKEINSLEKKIEEILKNKISVPEKPANIDKMKLTSPSLNKPNDLIDLLVRIDSKYSFDILRAIQLGEEQSITIKNFLSHLLYTLRKKGFSTYPAQKTFELDYEYSGLYKCIGFEVPPGGKVNVKVEKIGWAIIADDKIFPVNKAIIRKA